MGLKSWELSEESHYGTRARPAARHKRDAWSNNLVANRKAAKVAEDIRVLQNLYPETSVQCLTTTLPGRWHGIRKQSLVNQFDYMTKRVTLPGRTGWHSMRGLNTTLTQDSYVLGGWHFFECKYNKKKKWWNLHCHSLLFGDTSSTIPLSDYEIPKIWNEQGGLQSKELKSSTSGVLRELGFGERYTLDQAHSTEEQISYCTKLSYATKQVLDGPENELVSFLRGRKPRLSEAFGAARLSIDDRIGYHIEQDNHAMVEYLTGNDYMEKALRRANGSYKETEKEYLYSTDTT